MNQGKTLDEITINLKSIFLAFWSRRRLLVIVFSIVLLYFIASTYFLEKKWTVNTDLYINKANSSNYLEINPYAIEEASGLASLLSTQEPLADELELIQSPLVIDKVILENNLRFDKLFGFIPTKKTGEYLTTEKFLKGSKISFENKKGTHVLSISYTSKYKDIAYGVVTSIITNYIELHKELNSEKSKSDKKIIESEYRKAKADLTKKVNSASGLPTASLSGTGNLAAMSAFSRSAQSAMSTLRGQYLAGEKARVEITEDTEKVTQLASKLEWARLVEEMSDSSKVLVIKEPKPLRDWEYSSPKLFKNIIFGIIFGILYSLIAFIIAEILDKKLSFLRLDDNVIYDLDTDFDSLLEEVISHSNMKTGFVFFEELPMSVYDRFKDFQNIIPIKADITNSFKESLAKVDNIVAFASIGKTSSKKYKLVKKMISNLNKTILYEVLI